MGVQASPAPATVPREGGFLPIGAYGAIGDGRTTALVGLDGSIDWLCLPTFEGASVFGALLDPERGGRFELAPAVPFEAERRYLPGTNVLETTFRTDAGSVRVTDGMSLAPVGLLEGSELVRRAEGVGGSVPVRWSVEPRFGYGREETRIERRGGVPVAYAGADAVAIRAFDAGELSVADGRVSGEVELRDGDRALLSLSAAHEGPLLFPAREELEHRLDDTAERWRAWLAGCPYDGPWRDAVERSLLALKLLVYQASGGLLAAATTSLPEAIGGERNYDYRFAWVRDATFALDALLEMEMRADAHRSFSWLLDATRHTHPRLQPLYRLDGHPPAGQRELELPGYRGSRPVHEGNGAAGQPQHGNYADMLDTAWLYVRSGAALDEDSGRRLAQVADLACDLWRTPDSGIWELPEERNYTMSKISCWVAFDRALKLAEAGEVPDGHAPRWRDAASEVRAWVLERCWSEQRGAFTQAEDGDEIDASVLLGVRTGFLDGRDERMAATIEAVRRELGAGGKLLYRYSGMGDEEGAFVACSFWLAEALARSGRADEAAETIDGMLGHANDLALYSEEVDPSSGELLGNFPQGLSHLALLNAVAQHRNAVGDD